MNLKKGIIRNTMITLSAILMVLLGCSSIDNNHKNAVVSAENQSSVKYVNVPTDSSGSPLNFTYAAQKSIDAVVHVKTKTHVEEYYRSNPLYEFFYGPSQRKEERPAIGIGSGVIVSDEGYIVTNNHVIEKSDEIEVTLNDKRQFKAELVGTDPSTDIALLKIDAEDLSFIPYGNSDKLQIGEWVLAIGNPYNLTSTVTAGIVSAKSRSLNIINDRYRIEAFVQTDAALNQGNSGGALVNIKGQLVGINTAILSPSGAYSGNSFAVPVNIVQKVVRDLIEFGEVQRAILGVTIQTVNADLADKNDLDMIRGVYVEGLRENGAAKDAGIQQGDIIISIEGQNVNSAPELQEEISEYRPKDNVKITVIRDGKKKHFDVVLRNMYGSTDIVRTGEKIELYGAELSEVDQDLMNKLGIDFGAQVKEVNGGKFKEAGIKEGFIILKVNNKKINNIEDVKEIISNINGGVYIEGVYPNGMVAYYAFGV